MTDDTEKPIKEELRNDELTNDDLINGVAVKSGAAPGTLSTHPYSGISDTELEPGKPGSSQLLTKLRDNPEAIAAGSANAPRIQTPAFNVNSINADRLLDNTVNFTNKMLGTGTTGSENISQLASWIVPKGIYFIALPNTELVIQIDASGDWVDFGSTNEIVITNGVNLRVLNKSTTNAYNASYRKIF